MNEIMASIIASLMGLGFVIILVVNLLKESPGNDKMRELSTLIQNGASTFMKREYAYVSVVIMAIAIFFLRCRAAA